MVTDYNPERLAREARKAWGPEAKSLCQTFARNAPTANSRAEWLAAAKILERDGNDHE